MMERQTVLLRERFEIAMIRANADNIHFEFAHTPAEQQVGKTVFEL